jgi:hypothetical protein
VGVINTLIPPLSPSKSKTIRIRSYLFNSDEAQEAERHLKLCAGKFEHERMKKRGHMKFAVKCMVFFRSNRLACSIRKNSHEKSPKVYATPNQPPKIYTKRLLRSHRLNYQLMILVPGFKQLCFSFLLRKLSLLF